MTSDNGTPKRQLLGLVYDARNATRLAIQSAVHVRGKEPWLSLEKAKQHLDRAFELAKTSAGLDGEG